MLASYHGHAPLASLLVQHGADPNRLNDRGQSILAGAVFKNEPEVIEILLDAGADPEVGQPTALAATQVRLIAAQSASTLTGSRSSSKRPTNRDSRSKSRS
jgi:ankyrin repeat protein